MSPTTSSQVSKFVISRVTRLQVGYLERSSGAIGDLAALRQAGFRHPGDDPRVWNLLFEDLPPALLGKGLDAAYSERAINDALVLFAHHQQSQSTAMHRGGVRLGTAVGTLARMRGRDGQLDESTLKRFQTAALAQTHDARVLLLRHLVSMMRSADFPIPLDYGWLASDLYRFQFRASAHQVRLAWGRSLHKQDTAAQTTEAPEKEN